MQYKPNKDTKKAWIVVGFLTTIAFLFWLFGALSIGYTLINQAGLMVMLVADLLVVIRYLINEYVYSINENGYLTVTRVTSKNNKLLADIRISDDDIIVPAKKDMSEYGKLARIENFAVSIFPKQTYYYIFTSGDKRVALVLECSSDVAELIAKAIKEYGGIHREEDEASEE